MSFDVIYMSSSEPQRMLLKMYVIGISCREEIINLVGPSGQLPWRLLLFLRNALGAIAPYEFDPWNFNIGIRTVPLGTTVSLFPVGLCVWGSATPIFISHLICIMPSVNSAKIFFRQTFQLLFFNVVHLVWSLLYRVQKFCFSFRVRHLNEDNCLHLCGAV